MKVLTQGAKQWLQTLKQHWDVSKLTLHDSDECFAVMYYAKNRNIYVGYYNRVTGEGYVLDRRKEVRGETRI